MAESDFVANLQTGLTALAQQAFNQYSGVAVDMAIASGQQFFHRYDAELEDWKNQLVEGDMDEDDLRWLLQARDDLVNLETLKKEGLAKVALDSFVLGLIEVVISAAKAVP
jgi:hypothetical protein